MTLFAFFLPLFFVALFRSLTFVTGDNSEDVYYHVRVAAEGPSVFMARVFPALTMSVWENQFSDKEMLFHLILWILSFLPGTASYAQHAPFNVYGTIMTGFFLASFVGVCRVLGLRHLWFYSMSVLFIAPVFLNRIMMLRPHVLAVALIVLALPLLMRIDGLKKCLIGLAAGFVMAWAYSNPHFILLSACAVSVPCLLKRRYTVAFLVPLSCVAGIVAGYLVHPQFPNSFITWKIQCIDVVRESVGKPVVEIGAELSPAEGYWFLVNILFCLFVYVNYLLFVKNAERCGIRNMPDETLALASVSLVTFVGIFFGMRAIEYACPFNVILAGVLVRDSLKNSIITAAFFRKILIPAVFLVLVAAAADFYCHHHFYSPRRLTEYKAFAGWVREKSGIPPGTVIGNLDWSDFPQLYYGLPEYRYLSGMDPMFSYVRFPERISMLERFRKGTAWIPFEDLQALSGSRYLFLSARYSKQTAILKLRGASVIYEGADGFLLDLEMSRKTPR